MFMMRSFDYGTVIKTQNTVRLNQCFSSGNSFLSLFGSIQVERHFPLVSPVTYDT